MATSVALVALLISFSFPSQAALAGSRAKVTVPCQSAKLRTDYQIDQCLVTQMKIATTRMNSSLREESGFFRYATRKQDWRVAHRTQSAFMAYAREVCLAETNPYSSGTIEPILYGECALQLFHQRLAEIRRAISSFRNGGESQRSS
ncbi:MAG: lysozyme inhibitor LprI family protein [Acidimicrobiales bacterium]